MTGPYGTRWADIDEPDDVVEREDAAFVTALGIWTVENAFRPVEPDELPGQPREPIPGSLRAQVVEIHLETARILSDMRRTWRGRLLLRLVPMVAGWQRFRRATAERIRAARP